MPGIYLFLLMISIASQSTLKKPYGDLFHCLLQDPAPSITVFSISHRQSVSPSPLASFLLLITVAKNFQLGKLTGQLWLHSLDSNLVTWHRISLE